MSRTLVLAGRDLIVRAAIAELLGSSIIRAVDARHAVEFTRRIGGLLALTPDAVREQREPLGIEFVVLHVGVNFDRAKADGIGPKAIWELPAELDWLLDELNAHHTTTPKRITP
jgi:hypothetical protein